MFGQNTQDEDISTVNPTLDGGTTPMPSHDDAPTDTPATDAPTDAPADEPTTPEEPVAVETTAPETPPELPEETPTVDAPVDSSSNDDSDNNDDVPTTDSSAPVNTDLLDLKKQALEELSPLLDQLDQSPEEKFKTTMMMIQATDSSNLIKSAHEAALQISDEKVRAQALLDIVNEINYFTQPKE